MFKLLSALFKPSGNVSRSKADNIITDEPAAEIIAQGVKPFPFSASLQVINHLPVPDWEKVNQWLDDIADPDAIPKIWADCEIAWLLHLRQALGETYTLRRDDKTLILSTLKGNVQNAAFDFNARTRQRIVRLLDTVALVPEHGYDIVIIFEDEEDYYNYISRYHEDAGEYAYSSGMYINQGCGHFATINHNLEQMEPVIAHEMTHAYLAHLPLPHWLNEGITVNTEHQISPPGKAPLNVKQMHRKHEKFWTERLIQEFWSGESFYRPDDRCMLSYDLAKILVSHFARDWERFRAFVLAANADDAGHAAATAHLGISLGTSVATLFGKHADQSWQPDPAKWHKSR